MSLDTVFSGVSQAADWETKENPQSYPMTRFVYTSPEPRRHELGLIGGNNVTVIAGNMIDLESDLRGITRPNTFAPWRKHQPPADTDKKIVRNNTKGEVIINKTPVHLPTYQMWAYPAAYAPVKLQTNVCGSPQKY